MAEFKVTVTCAGGGAGTSTGTGTVPDAPIRGYIEAIAVKYGGAAPVTTTVTITENDNFLSRSVLAVPAGNTNTVFYPRAALVNQTATAITNSFGLMYVQYALNVAVGASNVGSTVEVHIYMSNTFWE